MMHSYALCQRLVIKLGKPISAQQTALTSLQPMASSEAVWSTECLLVGAILVKRVSAVPLGCVEQQLQLDTPTGTEV